MRFKIARTNPFNNKKEKYKNNEVDYFFLYCIETKWSGLISIEESPNYEIVIHYNPPISNNFNGYKMAQDYEFDYRINEIKECIIESK